MCLIFHLFLVASIIFLILDGSAGASRKPRSEIRQPKLECGGPNSVLYNVLDLNSKLIYVTCFDKEKLTPLFTVHKLNLNINPESMRSVSTFQREKHIYGTVKVSLYYKTHSWKFMELFNNEYKYCAYQYFCSSSVYLEKGLLVPDADFETNEVKKSTFNYINTVPLFKNVNQGDWLKLENHVRGMARDFKEARKNLGTYTIDVEKGQKEVEIAEKDYKEKSRNAEKAMKEAMEAHASNPDAKTVADLGTKAAKAGKLAESAAIHYVTRSAEVSQAAQAAKAARNASNTSSSKTDTLTIVTGAVGVARLLKNAKASERDLYLGTNHLVIPVPQLLWKAVIYPTDDRSSDVIFFRSNYYSERTMKMCTSICDEIGFRKIPKSSSDKHDEDDEEYVTELTVCCNLTDFSDESKNNQFINGTKQFREQIQKYLKTAAKFQNLV